MSYPPRVQVFELFGNPSNQLERTENIRVLAEGVKGMSCLAAVGFTSQRGVLRGYLPHSIEVYADGSFNLVLTKWVDSSKRKVIRYRVADDALADNVSNMGPQ